MTKDIKPKAHWVKETTLPKGQALTIDKRLLRSPAFCKLTGTAKHMYLEFLIRLKLDCTGKKNNQRFFASNNGKLTISYKFFTKQLGFSNDAISRGFKRLAACGFIDIVKLGCGVKRQSHEIALITNWKDYGTEKFKPGLGKADMPVNGGFKKKNTIRNLEKPMETREGTTTENRVVRSKKLPNNYGKQSG